MTGQECMYRLSRTTIPSIQLPNIGQNPIRTLNTFSKYQEVTLQHPEPYSRRTCSKSHDPDTLINGKGKYRISRFKMTVEGEILVTFGPKSIQNNTDLPQISTDNSNGYQNQNKIITYLLPLPLPFLISFSLSPFFWQKVVTSCLY